MFRDATPMRWTTSAIDCYYRGCVCSGCSVYKVLGNRCRMKQSVLMLVKRFGKPKRRKYQDLVIEESEE